MTMPAKCSLCKAQMYTLPVTSGRGTAVAVSICRRCDRRICKACDHAEQDVYAKRCSSCGERF